MKHVNVNKSTIPTEVYIVVHFSCLFCHLELIQSVGEEPVDVEVRIPELYPHVDSPMVFVRGKSDVFDNDACVFALLLLRVKSDHIESYYFQHK